MAINWIAAFKLIPWADVVQATPTVVRGAKDLWSRTRQANQAKDKTEGSPSASSPQAQADTLRQLSDRIAQLEAEQEEASALISSLAQQNAQLVVALDQLRRRVKVLFAFSVLLALAGAALWLR